MNLNAASCDTSDSFYHKYSLITGLTICKLVMRDIVHILYMQNVERTEKKYAFMWNMQRQSAQLPNRMINIWIINANFMPLHSSFYFTLYRELLDPRYLSIWKLATTFKLVRCNRKYMFFRRFFGHWLWVITRSWQGNVFGIFIDRVFFAQDKFLSIIHNSCPEKSWKKHTSFHVSWIDLNLIFEAPFQEWPKCYEKWFELTKAMDTFAKKNQRKLSLMLIIIITNDKMHTNFVFLKNSTSRTESIFPPL